MNRDKTLKVYYHERPVGILAETRSRQIAFEYDDSWIEDGFSISPFSLPLSKEVFVPKQDAVDGMFGVFRDSLPDAWGRLLVDRILKKNNVDISSIGMLDRLAIVGAGGMGALTYYPEWDLEADYKSGTLDEICEACKVVMQNGDTDELDMLFKMAGSSGGARPKVLISDDEGEWIVKFPSSFDSDDIGLQEFEYSKAAIECGITMPETKLFKSEKCKGYFGAKRFDRNPADEGTVVRKHMITAEGLLETNHRLPNLDYSDLMKLCKILTFSNKEALLQMFKRMCFNVFAHNRDDHSKNFAYLYNEEKGRYEMSPAYDLTYSTTYYGEHTTSVGGEAANPGMEDLVKVGTDAGLGKKLCIETAEEVKDLAVPLAEKWK